MKIITLTLNPAFDVHCRAQSLRLHKENYAVLLSRQSGGKGINLSRALLSYGIENTAITVIGTENGAEFKQGLDEDGIRYLAVETEGRIRENLTVHCPDAPETRLSFEGFRTDDEVLSRVRGLLFPLCDPDTVVTFTGHLPSGLSKPEVIAFLQGIKQTGARLVIDSNSFSREELFSLRPLLIKPNEQEISALVGREASLSELSEEARLLHEGGIDHVMISLGERGMLYCGECGFRTVTVPEITPVSTVGAGDSTVAGFLAGLSCGWQIERILCLAASFGTAACLTKGTDPPERDRINGFLEQISCH